MDRKGRADRWGHSALVDRAIAELGGPNILVNNAAIRRRYVLDGQSGRVPTSQRAAPSSIRPRSAPTCRTPHCSPMRPPKEQSTIYGRAGAALAKAGIRVNAVVPGLEWTPLIPSTMPPETGANSGIIVLLKRAAQPGELAAAYVMLADPRSRYTSGAPIAVTGGKPFL